MESAKAYMDSLVDSTEQFKKKLYQIYIICSWKQKHRE